MGKSSGLEFRSMSRIELYPALPRLSACVVLGDWKSVEEIRRSAPDECIDRTWREAVLQTHLFAGFPRLVAAFGVLESAGGLGQPEDDELENQTDPAGGHELFDQIYTSHASAVRETLASYHPNFAEWIAEHAYGRVLSRGGLSAGARELLAVACLIVLDQPRQLMSHARGALHCGATTRQLQDVLEDVRDLVPQAVGDRARRIMERLSE